MLYNVKGFLLISVALAAAPPGPGPFGSEILNQPVEGAARGLAVDGWKSGRLCRISNAKYNHTNATYVLQAAIDACGDRAGGGTVLITAGLQLYSASLWLRSNLTLRIDSGAAIIGTATGFGERMGPEAKKNINVSDASWIYTRRKSIMQWAHAGLINGGRCVKLKQPSVGWNDCLRWHKLHNVVLEGGGTIDGNADGWKEKPDQKLSYAEFVETAVKLTNIRPVLLDLLWIQGLTIRGLRIRRPGFWTVHPTFCDNVLVVNNDINVDGWNTDGINPDSSWNVRIANNSIATGDDCIALKAGRDWSGRMCNISTRNVLIENNIFYRGHGVSMGSETSAWILDVLIRNSTYVGPVDFAFRIKSRQGRGGGVRNISYVNASGLARSIVSIGIGIENNFTTTNSTAIPEFHDIHIENISFTSLRRERIRERFDFWETRRKEYEQGLLFFDTLSYSINGHLQTFPRSVIQTHKMKKDIDDMTAVSTDFDDYYVSTYLECIGLPESRITAVRFTNVHINPADNSLPLASTCSYCNGTVDSDSSGYLPCFVDPVAFYRKQKIDALLKKKKFSSGLQKPVPKLSPVEQRLGILNPSPYLKIHY